jgi:aryl-alcohol dehydrogenase-like predicted oxidoreductase
MNQVLLPGTTIRVSRIAYGTATLHHLLCSTERQALLWSASDVGITHFDTSPYYGYGLAESDLGNFIRGRRPDITLTTKVGLYPRGAANSRAAGVWVRKALGKLMQPWSLPAIDWRVDRARTSLTASLGRLGTDYVDFLLLHEPEPHLIGGDAWVAWLEEERSAGRVRFWGLAGTAPRVSPWVQAQHPLAQVVQTRDCLDQRQADFLTASGRDLQFTYGYLSSGHSQAARLNPEKVLQAALERNRTGAVLVSTRRAERLRILSQLPQ